MRHQAAPGANPESKAKDRVTHDAWVSTGSMNIPGKFATPREFLANLADIEQIAVTRLDEREFDGRKLVGFVLPRNSYLKDAHMLCHVWVDPQTRLPVRYECLPEGPGRFTSQLSSLHAHVHVQPALGCVLVSTSAAGRLHPITRGTGDTVSGSIAASAKRREVGLACRRAGSWHRWGKVRHEPRTGDRGSGPSGQPHATIGKQLPRRHGKPTRLARGPPKKPTKRV